ncbi:hypothetical protein [Actinobaculum sp. 352]|uniref:hypothetical protein n=1 Tax=Actinobaculum sp. 352 TaxID=2490946 RepID=UPI0013DF2C4F|nr:hypothetical protein [Actinobaculum sp. 352]
MALVKGSNGLIVEVADSVASSLLASGLVVTVKVEPVPEEDAKAAKGSKGK